MTGSQATCPTSLTDARVTQKQPEHTPLMKHQWLANTILAIFAVFSAL